MSERKIVITHKPLDIMYITQPFGVNWVRKGFYAKYGYSSDKHNGWDLRAPIGTPLYAPFDGYVKQVAYSKGGGQYIWVINKEGWEIWFGHLKKGSPIVQGGEQIKGGQKIAETGDTGDVTGAHLHMSLYPPMNERDTMNGYKGAVNPAKHIFDGWNKLPVDEYYGKKRNWFAEWKLRFKNAWVHRQLMKLNRHPLSLTSREVNAIIYGAWDWHIVMDPAWFPIWVFLTKGQYKKGKRPPIRLTIDSM